MKISLLQYSVDAVVAGAGHGRKVLFSMLDQCVESPQNPSVLIIDFAGIQLATASFLRESVFALKDHMRSRGSNWYPIFANVSPELEEEFAVLTHARRDAVILCNYNEAGLITHQRLFGNLDPVYKRTFDFVINEGEADAGGLANTYGDQENLHKPTAWNNRLKTLVERGVLMELTKGRAKKYRPAW